MAVESKPACEVPSDDWLALAPEPSHAPVVMWCEAHAAVILGSANLLLWGAVACGFQFG